MRYLVLLGVWQVLSCPWLWSEDWALSHCHRSSDSVVTGPCHPEFGI